MLLKKTPLILAAVIAVILVVNPFLPLVAQQVLYAISLTMKSLIIFILPAIIFCLLFSAVVNLAQRATYLVGDCIAIPIFAYAIMKNFGVAEPSVLAYAIFTFYFMLAKFSVAAVPGGGIIVMLPILEGYLGFNSSMLSLITAVYVLFDPVITCANVLANGAFAKMIDRASAVKLIDRVSAA